MLTPSPYWQPATCQGCLLPTYSLWGLWRSILTICGSIFHQPGAPSSCKVGEDLSWSYGEVFSTIPGAPSTPVFPSGWTPGWGWGSSWVYSCFSIFISFSIFIFILIFTISSGLLMLFSASVHACIYMLTLMPHSGSTEIPTPLKNGLYVSQHLA